VEGRAHDRLVVGCRRLLDAAHAALVEALDIPDYDRIQRIGEHARDHFRGGRMASEVDLGFEVQV
jgi:hypothetical protein